jgi:hypothetical protein
VLRPGILSRGKETAQLATMTRLYPPALALVTERTRPGVVVKVVWPQPLGGRLFG